MCCDTEKRALVKKRATNDSAESCFSSFTEMLNNYQMIDLFAVSEISNMKVNGYMRQPSTGKEIKERKEPALMLCIPDNFREALILTAIETVPEVRVRKNNKQALKKQQERRQQKEKQLYNEKIEKLALERK